MIFVIMPFAIVVVANGIPSRSTNAARRSGCAIRRVDTPMRYGAPRVAQQPPQPLDVRIGRRNETSARHTGNRRLGGFGERHVLRQVEVDRPVRLGDRDAKRLTGSGQVAVAQRTSRLGNQAEQRVVVDDHLHAASELVCRNVAGDGDKRRAIEPRAPVARFVAPGPVPRQTPGAPVRRPMTAAAKAAEPS